MAPPSNAEKQLWITVSTSKNKPGRSVHCICQLNLYVRIYLKMIPLIPNTLTLM